MQNLNTISVDKTVFWGVRIYLYKYAIKHTYTNDL